MLISWNFDFVEKNNITILIQTIVDSKIETLMFKFVTNMFENLDWDFILSAKIHIEINKNLTHTFTFDIRFSCKYLLFKLNILVMLFVF